MYEIEQENPHLSQLFATIYYVSLVTLIGLAVLELAKRGFVSFHFNLVWLMILVLVCGSLYSVFRIEKKRKQIFSNLVFIVSLFTLFFIFGAQIKVDFINPYLLGLFITISLGLAWYLFRPGHEGE